MTNEDFAQKIKDIRTRQDMSIDELAETSGVKLEVLQAMEEGEVIPSLTPLTKMARALGVRLGTFLDDTPELGPVCFFLSAKSLNFTKRTSSSASVRL